MAMIAGCFGGMIMVAFVALLWVWLFGPFIEANVEVEGMTQNLVEWRS